MWCKARGEVESPKGFPTIPSRSPHSAERISTRVRGVSPRSASPSKKPTKKAASMGCPFLQSKDTKKFPTGQMPFKCFYVSLFGHFLPFPPELRATSPPPRRATLNLPKTSPPNQTKSLEPPPNFPPHSSKQPHPFPHDVRFISNKNAISRKFFHHVANFSETCVDNAQES